MDRFNSPVEVVVGIIINSQNQILMTRRAFSLHQGGLWEFPGGKIEQDESLESALKRELYEELSIDIHQLTPLITITHHYVDKHVRLHAFIILKYSGEPTICDGQLDLQWIPLKSWNPEAYPLPAANLEIMAEIQKNFGALAI